MSALESRIDDLYRGPLGEFVSARNALAKSVSGDEAKRVRTLPKPTVVPWAINQVYWHARSLYDRVVKTGTQLRDAQVAALGGKKVDIRAATEAHRKAIAEAVQQAERFAAQSGSHPPADALTRTFEAISLAAEPLEAPGRLTRPLQPAGFEALAGIKVAPQFAKRIEEARAREQRDREQSEAERRKAEAARKKHEAEIKKAEAALERARRKMADAEAALRAKRRE